MSGKYVFQVQKFKGAEFSCESAVHLGRYVDALESLGHIRLWMKKTANDSSLDIETTALECYHNNKYCISLHAKNHLSS